MRSLRVGLVLAAAVALYAFADRGPSPTGPVIPPDVVRSTLPGADGGLTYFVDVRGNNANTCLAPFTDGGINGPCRHPQGALDKLPKFIDQNVFVSIDAGFYDGGITFDDFYMRGNARITLQGPDVSQWTTYTPKAGSATGALTAVSAISFPTRGILTDALQAWPAATSSDSYRLIRGRFVCITSGSGINQARPIAYATPTTLEYMRAFSPVPVAPATYKLCVPAATISVNVDFHPPVLFGNGAGNVVINDLELDQVGANFASYPISFTGENTLIAPTAVQTGTWDVTIQRSRLSAESSSNFRWQGLNRISFTDVAMVGTDTTNLSQNTQGSVSNGPATALRFTDTYFHCQRNCVDIIDSSAQLNGVQIDSENITTGNGPVLAGTRTGAKFVLISNTWVYCESGDLFGSNSNEDGFTLSNDTTAIINSIQVKGCFNGINIAGKSAAFTSGLGPPSRISMAQGTVLSLVNIGNDVTSGGYGIRIGPGSQALLQGATVTMTNISDGGRDYVFWNDHAYTESFMQGLASDVRYVNEGGAILVR